MGGDDAREITPLVNAGLIFTAALVAILRVAGTSPVVWVDTFNDDGEVRQCLLEDSCTLTGVSTSLPGQSHAVAWLELRALLRWFGVGIDGTHVAMSMLNAIGAVLVYYVAAVIAGPLAGVLATGIFLYHLNGLFRACALYNSSILPFFGAVLVIACVAVVLRPGLVSVTYAAVVAAIMANIHLACVLTGASVVWAAFAAPRRRVLLAAWGAAVFVVVTIALAPPSWLHNAMNLLQRDGPRVQPAAVTGPNAAMIAWTLVAVAGWLLSFTMRVPAMRDYRRHVAGAVAVIVPFAAAFVIAPSFGLHAEAKYLLHVKAATAVAAAVPIALLIRALARGVSLQWLLAWLEPLAPWVFAVLIVFPASAAIIVDASPADEERTPTMRDMYDVVHILHDEDGWDAATIPRNVKTPYGLAASMALKQFATATTPANAAPRDDDEQAVFVVLDTTDLPDPLPPRWHVIRRSARVAALLAVLPSRIDWTAFVVCELAADGAAKKCEHTGWRSDQDVATAVPSMPPGATWRGTLQLRLPLKPREFASEVFMPRTASVCAGRIVGAVGAVEVEAGQRAANIAAAAQGADPSLIELEWNVGGADCNALSYEGLPPFFVEGEAPAARALAAILRRQERVP